MLKAGCIELHALHTPSHSPGSALAHPQLNAVICGDALFDGGPAATGRSYSEFPTILASISKRLGLLPGQTVVYTSHGDITTIGDEIVHYDAWGTRGHSPGTADARIERPARFRFVTCISHQAAGRHQGCTVKC